MSYRFLNSHICLNIISVVFFSLDNQNLLFAIFQKMDKITHHQIICYVGTKALSPKEIHEDMVATLGEDAHLYIVKNGLLNLNEAGKAWR